MSVHTGIRDPARNFSEKSRNYRLPSVNQQLTPNNNSKLNNTNNNSSSHIEQKPNSAGSIVQSVTQKTISATLNVGGDRESTQKSSGVTALTHGLKSLSFTRRTQSSNDLKRPQSTFPRFLTTSTCSIPAACNSLEDIAKYFVGKKVQKIVVMAGAGISTESGIPDFRTPGSGLYDNLKQYKIPFPEAIFDLDFFHANPRPFFTLAKELYPSGIYRPNMVHYFLRLLHDKGRLLRIYTQNIDGLERLAGIPAEKLVEAHGTFSTATCRRCGLKYRGTDVKAVIDSDEIPRCSVNNCQGIIKPDIVFFGEDLPLRFYSYMADFRDADMLFVMGTSLEVEPFAGIVDATRAGIPRVLFNRDPVGVFKRKTRAHDVVASGDLISSILSFTEYLSWKDELETLKDTCETAAFEAQRKAAELKAKKHPPTDPPQPLTQQPPPSPARRGGGRGGGGGGGGGWGPAGGGSSRPPFSRLPFNRGYSTHPALVPISQSVRFPRLGGGGGVRGGRPPPFSGGGGGGSVTRFQRRPAQPPAPPIARRRNNRRRRGCSSSSSSSSGDDDSSTSSSSDS